MKIQSCVLPLFLASGSANIYDIKHYYFLKDQKPVLPFKKGHSVSKKPPSKFSRDIYSKEFNIQSTKNHLYEPIERLSQSHDLPFSTASTNFIRKSLIEYETAVDYNIFCMEKVIVTDAMTTTNTHNENQVIVNTDKDPKLRAYLHKFVAESKGKTPEGKAALLVAYTKAFFHVGHNHIMPRQKEGQAVYLGNVPRTVRPTSLHYALLSKLLADHVDGIACKVISGALRNEHNKRHAWVEILTANNLRTSKVSDFYDDGLVQKTPAQMSTLLREQAADVEKKSSDDVKLYMLDCDNNHFIHMATLNDNDNPPRWRESKLPDETKNILRMYGAAIDPKLRDKIDALRRKILGVPPKSLFEAEMPDAPFHNNLPRNSNSLKKEILWLEKSPYYET